MKFLLNVNVPRDLGKRLSSQGHVCRHAADIGLGTAPDTAMVEEARRAGEIILTHDLDYGHILAFSGFRSPSVVIFRTESTHSAHLAERLLREWPEIAAPLGEGAIVVIEDAALRIRRLPIN